MTFERGFAGRYPTAADVERRNLMTPDQFLSELFDRSVRQVAKEKRIKKSVANFVAPEQLRLNGDALLIIRGNVFRNKDYDYGLAFGRIGGRTRPEYQLEFGFAERKGRALEPTVGYLEALVRQPCESRASGKIYSDHGVMIADCFAADAVPPDNKIRLADLAQETFLGPLGIKKALAVIQRTFDENLR